MNSIYNIYVEMESQEQCDRMKQVCVDNGLPIWDDAISFVFFNMNDNLTYSKTDGFFIACSHDESKTEVTESEFLNILKDEK